MSSPGFSADIRQRLDRVKAAELCRFCLTKHELVSIPENQRIQELLSECFGGVLGELVGNSTQYICARCYQRVEQNYEFLLMASRVQALMDTFTYHEGVWPRKALLEEDSKQCEKRVAAFDSDERTENPVKRPRLSEKFGGVLSEMGFDSSASSSAPNSVEMFQCLTPSVLWTDTGSNGSSSGIGGELKSSTVEIVSEGASLETTLSGEIPSEDLEESPASSPAMEQCDLDLSLDDDFFDETTTAVRKFSACELKCGESSCKDMAVVQKLCFQIEDIEVGERKFGVKSHGNLSSCSTSKSIPTRNKTN